MPMVQLKGDKIETFKILSLPPFLNLFEEEK
jgi:hypothetical protein